MRDFHRVMAESNAVLKYNSDHIVIQVNVTSLESLKEIADVIHAEFDCEPKSVSVVPESGAIVLKVPCLNNTTCAISVINNSQLLEKAIRNALNCAKPECRAESETETEEDTKQSFSELLADRNNKILTTAIEVLREKGALTSTELEQELAKRGVIAPSNAIGMALADSGLAVKRGSRWKIKEDVAETDPEENGWKQLTKRGYYKIDGDDVVIGFKNGDGKIILFKRVPLQILREIYEKLPDKTGAKEFIEIATEHGLKMSNFQTYYMRVLADVFGGEVVEEGKKFILVKGD